MAITGLSIPVFAKYHNKGNKVGYSDKHIPGKAINYSVKVTSSDDNILYADNQEAENDSGVFQSGELSLGTDRLTNETSQIILGLKTTKREIDGKQYEEVIYDDSANAPYLGVGIIEQHRIDGATKYRPVWLDKIKFNIPESSVNTRGESIEWQTPSVTGKIMRSDYVGADGTHPWKHDGGMCDTESEALAYLEFWAGYDPDNIVEAGAVQAANVPDNSEGTDNE